MAARFQDHRQYRVKGGPEMVRKRRPESPNFGPRGSKLFDELKATFDNDPARMLLLVEACRLADRLDGLNEAISARGVVGLLRFRSILGDDDDDGTVRVELHFDSVLAEARQQANALRLLLGQIAPAVSSEKPEEKPQEGPSVADFAARRRARAAARAAAPAE